ADYKVPRDGKLVEELPRDPSAKGLKRLLRQAAQLRDGGRTRSPAHAVRGCEATRIREKRVPAAVAVAAHARAAPTAPPIDAPVRRAYRFEARSMLQPDPTACVAASPATTSPRPRPRSSARARAVRLRGPPPPSPS